MIENINNLIVKFQNCKFAHLLLLRNILIKLF